MNYQEYTDDNFLLALSKFVGRVKAKERDLRFMEAKSGTFILKSGVLNIRFEKLGFFEMIRIANAQVTFEVTKHELEFQFLSSRGLLTLKLPLEDLRHHAQIKTRHNHVHIKHDHKEIIFATP